MKKQFKSHPRFWISLAFSALITMLTLIAARDGAEGSILWWPVQATRSDIESLDKAVSSFQRKNGALPKSLAQLNQGLGPAQKLDLDDSWARPFIYKVEGKNYKIISYGRDEQPGGVGRDCDLSNDNLNPPESHLSYQEFFRNPATVNMAAACLACSLLAFFIGWITIGKLDIASAGYKTLVVKLIITIGGTLYITFCIVMLHVPSGH